jgi:hypothetical protein
MPSVRSGLRRPLKASMVSAGAKDARRKIEPYGTGSFCLVRRKVIANQNFFSAIRSNFRSKSSVLYPAASRGISRPAICADFGTVSCGQVASPREATAQRTVRHLLTRVQECESSPPIEL